MVQSLTKTSALVAGLYRYPVKGLSPAVMSQVALTAGEAISFDRAWAIENGPGRFDAANPRHLPKINFLMLMRNERLASLDCLFDEATKCLTIHRGGKAVVKGDLTTRAGRAVLEQFFAQFMQSDLRGPPKIVDAPGHSFSDVNAKCLHVINLASLRELERVAGRPINPLRFRPNVIVDNAPAWSEFGWVGKEASIGTARLRIFERTDRCAATNVDPATGVRDMDIPAQLARGWRHTDFGVYASVIHSGTVSTGDAFEPSV